MEIEEVIANRLEALSEVVAENFCGLIEFYHECTYEVEETKWVNNARRTLFQIWKDDEIE